MKIAKARRVGQSFGMLLGFLGVTGIGMTHIIFPGLHCYACPWAITVCPIGLAQNLVIFGTVPYFWIGMIVAYGMAAGRGFCGWFCPFGTLNDLLSFRKVKVIGEGPRRIAGFRGYAIEGSMQMHGRPSRAFHCWFANGRRVVQFSMLTSEADAKEGRAGLISLIDAIRPLKLPRGLKVTDLALRRAVEATTRIR